MQNPRLLVISNNSFSKTSSNGRTLGNYFEGWEINKIAQFCISTTKPNYKLCNNYFCITDKEALKAFLQFRKAKRIPIEECLGTEANTTIASTKRSFKTATKALIRNFVWKNRWDSHEFRLWVDEFAPEVVLVMNSDSAFILNIAKSVSIRKKIPLVMYNTEGFYFFKKDYMAEESFIDPFCFKIYQKIYKRAFRSIMNQTSITFHLNDLLKSDFYNEFGGKHDVLYSASSLKYKDFCFDRDNPYFSYLGNFGFDRASPLIEIAEVLGEINPNFRLHIYGKIPRQDIVERFGNCPYIEVEGMVSYEKVIDIMYQSTILFHAENQNERYEEMLKYGFTTKIADSLSCGVPFLMYSSPNNAGAIYLRNTNAAWVASNKIDLKEKILEILNNERIRTSILSVARKIANQNHNEEKIKYRFWKTLESLK